MTQSPRFNRHERQESSYLKALLRDANQAYVRPLRLLGEAFGGATMNAKLRRESFPINYSYLLPQYYLGFNSEASLALTTNAQRRQPTIRQGSAEMVVPPVQRRAQTQPDKFEQSAESAHEINIPEASIGVSIHSVEKREVENSTAITIPERNSAAELSSPLKSIAQPENVAGVERDASCALKVPLEPDAQLKIGAKSSAPDLQSESDKKIALLESFARYKAKNKPSGAGQSLAQLERYLEAHNFGEPNNAAEDTPVLQEPDVEIPDIAAQKLKEAVAITAPKLIAKVDSVLQPEVKPELNYAGSVARFKLGVPHELIQAESGTLRLKKNPAALRFASLKPKQLHFQDKKQQLEAERSAAPKKPQKVIVKKKVIHVATSESAPAFWERSYMSRVQLRLYR
jgi:hypothetical protein